VIAVTLTGSPSHAIARTPIHRFVPRFQVKLSYGFDISSACDNLYCRPRSTPIFITMVMRNAMGTPLNGGMPYLRYVAAAFEARSTSLNSARDLGVI